MFPGPTSAALPDNWLEMQMFELCHRPAKSETRDESQKPVFL